MAYDREAVYIQILVCLSTSAVVAINPIGFYLEPQSQEVIEGRTAEFFCQCHSDVLSCSWTVNGSQLDGRPDVRSEIEDLNGRPTSVLSILAFPEYTDTHVQCIATTFAGNVHRSQVALLSTRGVITNLTLQSSMTAIVLTWELALPTDQDYSLRVRIGVYSLDMEPILSEHYPNQSDYEFFIAHPDPSQPYTFMVTPIFENRKLDIFRSGTPATLTGYFLSVPLFTVQVDVTILESKEVFLTFTLDNAVPELVMTGRKADAFSVVVESDGGLGTNCSGAVLSASFTIVNSTVMFSLLCSSLPTSRHLIAHVTATNEAGSTNLTTPFSTLPLQNVDVQGCDVSIAPMCQFVVKFQSKLVDAITAVVLAHNGHSDVHSFVNTLFTYGERGEVALNGLLPGNYSVSLLALYNGRVVLVYHGNVLDIPMLDIADQRTEHLENVVVEPQLHNNYVRLECVFLPDSPATGCGLLLVNLSRKAEAQFFWLQRESGRNTASDSVEVREKDWVSVIAFAYMNTTLSGRPYVIENQFLGVAKGGLSSAAIITIVIVSSIISVALVAVIVCGYYLFKRYRRRCCGPRGSGLRDDDGDRPTSIEDNIELAVVKKPDEEHSSDSGLGTQPASTSTVTDVLPSSECEGTQLSFQESQPVHTPEDASTLVISMKGGTNFEAREERAVHKQEETIGSSSSYYEALRPTLNMPQPVAMPDDDSLDTYTSHSDLNMSGTPFINVLGEV